MGKPLAVKYHRDRLFSLKIEHHHHKTCIHMKMFTHLVHTKHIPDTHEILCQKLPSIMHCCCFNEDKLPFREEVKNTEVGHLFEHIMLEYLSYYKKLHHNSRKFFNGLTSWNFQKYGQRVFKIFIDVDFLDREIFNASLDDSISLFNTILYSVSSS